MFRSHRHPILVRRAAPAAAPVLVLAFALTACAGAPESPLAASQATPAEDAHAAHAAAPAGETLTADQLRTIAAVRHATAQFHDLALARTAGYGVQFPAGCASSPGGAQGYHYFNAELAADDVLDPLRPELLMYEPQPGGGMQLVGVDYVVPFTVRPATATPPTLLGVPLAPLPALGVWAIHIWAWRPNPSGMFAPWNPKVSCAHAR